MRDPSFPTMDSNGHNYPRKHDLPQQLTYNSTGSTKLSTRIETQNTDTYYSGSENEKTLKAAQNRKKNSIFNVENLSRPPYLNTGKFNEARTFGSERKSSRTELSSERLSTKRSVHSRSPSERQSITNEHRHAKPKRETFSVGNLKDVIKLAGPSGKSNLNIDIWNRPLNCHDFSSDL